MNARTEALGAFEKRCRDVLALALHDVPGAMRESDALLEAAGDDADRAVLARVARSHALCYAGDLAAGLDALDKVATLARAAAPRLQALLANARVQPLMRLGRLQEANDAARTSSEMSRRLGDDVAAAKALVALGATERALGRTRDAARVLGDAVRLAGDQRAVAAAASSNLAECLLDDDRFHEALEAFENAATEFEAVGHGHAAAIARGNVADLLGRLGRIDDAMRAFESARRQFEAGNAELDAARLSCEEAEMLAHAGALRAARDRYVAALPTLERAGAAPDLARARLALAGVLVDLKDAGGARRLYESTAVELIEESIADAEAVHGLARCDLADGRPDLADKRIRSRLLPLLTERPARRARALLTLARAALAAERISDARDAVRRAETDAADAGLDGLRPLCAAARAACAEDDGDHANALLLLDDAAEDVVRTLEATASPAARAGLTRLFQPILARRATLAFDHARADAPDAVLAAAHLVGDDARDADETHAPIRARLDRVSDTIARIQFDAGAFPERAAEADLHSLRAEAELLRERLGDTRITMPRTRLTADEIAGRLASDEIVVHWFTEENDLSALVISRDGAAARRRVAPLERITTRCRRLAFIAERADDCDDELMLAWRRIAEGLRADLLDALALPDDTILRLVGPPELGAAPWHAIADDGRRLSVAHTPRDLLRGTTLAEPECIVLLGADDGTLPCVPREIESCAAHWSSPIVRIGGSTAAALELVARADVLHVATHGVFVPDRPRASRFLIGDAWVTIGELAPHIRPGAVVILSACHAARAGGLAEDFVAIPGVLREAGAHAVVAPVWPLADDAAADFFPRLHARLARDLPEQLPVSASLRDAVNDANATFDILGVRLHGGLSC